MVVAVMVLSLPIPVRERCQHMFIRSGDVLLRRELTAAWDEGPFPRTPSENPAATNRIFF